MAKKETFLLVSLEEDKAKKLAQVISNDTCRSILDYLANKKATETELSQQLNIPISTVHYNLKHLVDNKLVEAEEFHYSEKGKEVLHYSLSNKYVIIAPKGVSDKFRDKLRSIIPAIAIVGAIAFAIQFIPSLFSVGASKMGSAESAPMLQTSALDSSQGFAASAARETAVLGSSHVFQQASQSIGIWFVLGAVIFMMIYLVFEYLRKRSKKQG